MNKFLVGLCFISLQALGQAGMAPILPVDGFIVLQNGDSIYGKIVYTQMTGNFMSEIKFTDFNKNKTVYTADEIQGMGLAIPTYAYEDITDMIPPPGVFWEVYECRPHPKNKTMVFIQRFTDGKIKVFHNRSAVIYTTTKETAKMDGIGFSFSSEGGLYIGPTYQVQRDVTTTYSSYFVEKNGGEFLKLDKKIYETTWPSLFGDCEAINREVEKNPDLKKFKNFLLVVELYNYMCQ